MGIASRLFFLFIILSVLSSPAQNIYLNAGTLMSRENFYESLPRTLKVSNDESSSHVQGVAVDTRNGYIYFSFTTKLIKTNLYGKVVGSVRGFSCHLGCIELDLATGKLYASIEYKDDAIGQGISGGDAIDREKFLTTLLNASLILLPNNLNCFMAICSFLIIMF